MFKVTRRQSIATGAAGSVLLALAGCTRPTLREPFDAGGYRYRVLGPADRELFAAVASVMLSGAFPTEPTARRSALAQTVEGIDAAISGLPPSVVDELRQLLSLLQFPPTRAIFAGVWSGWGEADARAVTTFLARWRFSRATLFRSGYQALHQLVMAAWYGNAASWTHIGYSGPPDVSS